jgi:alpha-tubulin suppressor-like RCC1 family protein
VFASGILDNPSGSDGIVVKYDADLVQQGSVSWDNGGIEGFLSLAVDADGTVYAGGSENSDAVTADSLTERAVIVAYANDLETFNDEFRYSEPGCYVDCLAIAKDNTLYALVTGNDYSLQSIARLNGDLEVICETPSFLVSPIAIPSMDEIQRRCNSIACAGDGSVYAAGAEVHITDGEVVSGTALITRLDIDMQELNTVCWRKGIADAFYSVGIDESGCVYSVGVTFVSEAESDGTTTGNIHAVIIK